MMSISLAFLRRCILNCLIHAFRCFNISTRAGRQMNANRCVANALDLDAGMYKPVTQLAILSNVPHTFIEAVDTQ